MKQLVLILMTTLLFNKGKCENECELCNCCKNGETRCYNNYCLDGCIGGYFGVQCRHACIANCLVCNTQRWCITCKDGYYGNSCKPCPGNCLTCPSSTYCHICKDGYYKGSYQDDPYRDYYSDCRLQCRPNCQSCSSYNTCNVCKEGFYDTNTNCVNKCKKNCQSCISDGVCTECKSGYYSDITKRDCSLSCYKVCKSCTSYYECTECFDGFYYSSSTKNCMRCNGSCISCSNQDTCISCVDGKYSDYNNDCRKACRPECIKCDSIYYCSECISGRYGSYCQNKCGRGCKYVTCDKSSGNCNCKTGFSGYHCNTCQSNKYGTNCDLSCAVGCKSDYCDDSGKCTCKNGYAGDKCDKCEKGKYGIFCNKICPDGCEDNSCFRNGSCHTCKLGKYGNSCTGSCSEGCKYGNCTLDGECSSCKDGFIGKKCDMCIGSKYGNKCDHNCSLTCLSCESLTNCSACIVRHWGNKCQPCPTNCLNCYSESTCSSCDKGFHGQICNEQCNDNCFDRRCDQLSGNCSVGCVVGFYGKDCDIKCSPYCANSICGREHGNCLHGCKTGYNGTKCSQSLELMKEGDGDMNVVTGATAGGVLVLIVILVIVITIILIKRRRRGDKLDNNNKGIKTDDANMTYSEINDIHMTAENNHTDDIETERENITYSEINDAVLSTKSQESDNIYAKPIKPKRKTEAIKSLNRNSNEVTVNNPTYEKPDTSQPEMVEKAKNSKPPIASKPAQKYDNNVIPKPSAMQPTSHISHIQNDAALEIEEDIDCLSSRSKSVFIEEQKAAELENADTYYNVAAVIKRKITLDKLPDFVAKKTKKDFVDEFQALPAMLIKPYVDSQKRENRSKNRYKGIYPYDDTRVVLREGDSDYINASYIDGYNKNKAYIASIGPTYKYMGDMSAFWIMVWQENVGKIVMLTNLEEGGVPKCDLYWPEKDFSLMFANIQVTCHTEENYADYTFRSFSVQKDSTKREIVQVHFTAWPDKGTPDDVTSLIEFRQKVNSTKTKLDGPILVHCSAGIGRTGTYIALDSITNEGETEGAVDIYAFVRNMREQRVNMIQTAEQYQYLHNALVHTLTFDSKAVESSMFNEYTKTHTEDHLGNMFEKLQASVEQRTDDEQEAVKRNKTLVNKTRNGADIPGDRNRPRLFMAKTPGQSDYINAVYVNSFKNVNRFLIAQTPLPDTVEDFLTLIVQEKVSCVISMETMSSANKDAGIYCPADNQTLRKGAFTIKTERGDGTDQYHLKKMKISYKSKSGSEEIIVPHVQYTQWDSNKSIPEEPVKFVQFVKDMELKFSGTDTNRPMLVHCLTGAEKGGLFCVVSTLLEKTQIDQEVSVANTVRQIKYRRHLAVPDKDQYIFCHHCVNEYLRTFDIYSNFELKT